MPRERHDPTASERESSPGAPCLAIRRLFVRTLEDGDVTWALTGSIRVALRPIPLRPDDVGVPTTEEGAYATEKP